MADGPGRVRLLHVSDLHIGGPLQPPFASRYAPEVLEKLARRIYGLRDHLDGILISGDLCASGTQADLNQAALVVSGPIGPNPLPWLSPQGLPTLQAARKAVSLLPGNHDRYAGYYHGAGGTEFDSVFRTYWEKGVGGVEGCLLPGKARPLLGVLKADFALARTDDEEGVLGWLGQGRAYEERLDALVAETRRLRPLPVVWFLHFAPLLEQVAGYKFSKQLWLLDGQRLIEEAVNCQVRHILCGHSHQGLVYWAGHGRKVRVYCAGTACCRGDGNDTCAHVREMIVHGGLLTIRSVRLAWNASAGVGGDFVWEREKEM